MLKNKLYQYLRTIWFTPGGAHFVLPMANMKLSLCSSTKCTQRSVHFNWTFLWVHWLVIFHVKTADRYCKVHLPLCTRARLFCRCALCLIILVFWCHTLGPHEFPGHQEPQVYTNFTSFRDPSNMPHEEPADLVWWCNVHHISSTLFWSTLLSATVESSDHLHVKSKSTQPFGSRLNR